MKVKAREVVCGTRKEGNCRIVTRKALALKAGRRSEHDRLEREICSNCNRKRRIKPLKGYYQIRGQRVYYI